MRRVFFLQLRPREVLLPEYQRGERSESFAHTHGGPMNEVVKQPLLLDLRPRMPPSMMTTNC
jgi:hypothetical protein